MPLKVSVSTHWPSLQLLPRRCLWKSVCQPTDPVYSCCQGFTSESQCVNPLTQFTVVAKDTPLKVGVSTHSPSLQLLPRTHLWKSACQLIDPVYSCCQGHTSESRRVNSLTQFTVVTKETPLGVSMTMATAVTIRIKTKMALLGRFTKVTKVIPLEVSVSAHWPSL